MAEKVDRFLQSNLFIEAFTILSKSETAVQEITKLAEGFDLETIRVLCEQTIEKEIGEYSIGQLRKIARKMCLPYYTSFTKAELLSTIVQRKKKDVAA